MVVRFFILASICLTLFGSCADQKLSLTKSIITSSLRLDGFYFSKHKQPPYSSYGEVDTYHIVFYYSNGVKFDLGTASVQEFGDLENLILRRTSELRDDKLSWGLYVINGDKIICERWNTSIGGGLPKSRAEGYVPNDSTIIFTKNINYDSRWLPKITEGYESMVHFHKFSPKPDSTNNFIK